MSTFSTSPPPDEVQVRCPRLGHQVYFGYCRAENMGTPCFKTLDCWHLIFDVVGYFKQHLSEEAFAAAFLNRGRPKIQTLVDLIHQAKDCRDPSHGSGKGPGNDPDNRSDDGPGDSPDDGPNKGPDDGPAKGSA
jgi:hypothetical protein